MNLIFGVVLVWYQRVHDKTIFILAVLNTIEKVTKRSYIIVIKNNQEMLRILESKPIKGEKDIVLVDPNDFVYIIKSMFTVEIIKLKEIEEYQFGNNTGGEIYTYREGNMPTQSNSEFIEIKLTFPNLTDDRVNINFIPMIYQHINNIDCNRLLIYDVIQEEFATPIHINPTFLNQKLMYTDESGYNCYSICRTSDVDQKGFTRKDVPCL